MLILNVISEMKQNGIKVSELIARIKKYENSGEINFRIENKQAAMESIIEYYTAQEKPDAYFDFDGYRIEYKNWWLNIRQSNTEPFLRFLAEANSSQLLNEITNQVTNIIEKLGGKIDSGH